MKVLSEGQYVLAMRERIYADMPNVRQGLNKLAEEVMRACFVDRAISEETATSLQAEIQARIDRQLEAAGSRAHVGSCFVPLIKATPNSAPKAEAPKETEFQAAERERRAIRIDRRRLLARVASVPADIARKFSMAEQAVLAILTIRCRRHERCDLPVSIIARRAYVSERTVQSTIRKAEGFGFVSVQYRRRLSNVVRVVSKVWRDWWVRPTPITENQKSLISYNITDPLLGANSVRLTPGDAPKAKPIEVKVVARVAALMNAHPYDPEPEPFVPVAKPRPKPVPPPSVNARLDALKAQVAETAKTRPEPVSGLDPWMRPEVEPWMSQWDRQWMADKEAVEPLSRYPQVRTERGALTDEVQRWLADRCGAPGRLYSIHTFFREGHGFRDADRRIGFASWRDAMEFKLAWRT